jgi:transcription initiation factor IIE alpha subunit
MPPVVDARRTKRVRDVSEEMSLEEHIVSKRAALVKERREAHELKETASKLRKDAAGMNRRWEKRKAADAIERADLLEREAEIRESMVREHDYEATVVTYLRMYHKRVESTPPISASRKSDTIEAYVRQTDMTGQRQAAILDEYLVQMNQAPPKVAMAARDDCPKCSVKLLLCTSKSIMTCPECGYAVTYLDATSSSTSFDEIVEYSQYSYKRANHFSMWIALCQGKEAHRVPQETLDKVMEELYQHRVKSSSEITQKKVRDILRRLRLRKAYDHVAQVTSRLSGIPPLRISPDTEERLRIMFLQMQPVFEKHAPKSRTNFLSYSYVLYRCFQIMGMNHMLDGLTLLKGKDKLELNDSIFRKMCVDLGWPVFDLPSTGV